MNLQISIAAFFVAGMWTGSVSSATPAMVGKHLR